MADQQSGVFISYKRQREDSNLVDRLDADLHVREIKTWVDRRKLEGGQNWEQEIEGAIARCEIFVVVLSKAAANSPYVRQEYEIALRLPRRIIPLMIEHCELPSALAAQKLQYIDFTDKGYDAGVKELLYVIQDPSFDIAANEAILDEQAAKLEQSDPERAALLYQRILDKNPHYFGGRARRDLDRLSHQLYPQRARRLREEAEAARRRGAYGAEAGALEALISLGDENPALFAWAQEYLPVAQQNRMLLEPYEVTQQLVVARNLAKACDRLRDIWSQAPYFRDPANIAPELGLIVPPTYEQAMAINAHYKSLDEFAAKEAAAAAAAERKRLAEATERKRLELLAKEAVAAAERKRLAEAAAAEREQKRLAEAAAAAERERLARATTERERLAREATERAQRDREAAERKRKDEEAAERKRKDKAEAVERDRFGHACALLQGDVSRFTVENVRADLQRQQYDLIDSAATVLVGRIIESQRQYADLKDKVGQRNHREKGSDWGVLIDIGLVILTFVGVSIACSDIAYTRAQATLFIFVVSAVVAAVVAAMVALVLYNFERTRESRREKRIERLSRDAEVRRAQAEQYYQQWRQIAERVYLRRVEAINP